jgi:very-short-patch-repair endonuclease
VARPRPARFPNGAPPEAVWGNEHGEDARSPKSQSRGAVWEIEQVVGCGEREVRRIATCQRGLILREQLLTAGIGRGAITHRVDTGWLKIAHPGVYLVGHDAPAPFVAEMGAVLCFRGDAVLSHRTAAAIWVADRPSREVEVTLAGRDCRSRPGVRVFRVPALHRQDFRWRNGLPVTSPARTMIDYAGSADIDETGRALGEMRVLGLVRDSELQAAMARSPRRKGVGRLRQMLSRQGGPAFTRSEAERRLLELIAAAELPPPQSNARVLGYEVDAFWRRQRLVVEVDGYAFHGHRQAFEHDRRRDQTLTAAGYKVIRVTWRQLESEALAVVARIAQALGGAPPEPG